MLRWREKTGGLISPDERLPWPATITLGIQHILALFGATVVVPLVMGFDPNLAIFFSGIGTLLFFIVTGGRVPSYLGSSFAFIGPVAAVIGSPAGNTLDTANIPLALGGIVAVGILYALAGALVQLTGSGWIEALMPPLVTGAVVMIIGLNLAGSARGLAEDSPALALITIMSILVIALVTRGFVSRLPIILGAVIGSIVALIAGGTSTAGRTCGSIHIQGLNLDRVKSAAWFGTPNFVTPRFSGHAITIFLPVVLVLIAENTGHLKAIEAMTESRMMPMLGRAFIGDGLATTVAGLGGGTGITTYAENIGVMAVTRVYSTIVFVIAGAVAILMGLSPKFGALVGAIPTSVIGGVVTVLFGLIAITGARIWVTNQVDFTRGVNLFVAAVVIIVGAADYTLRLGRIELGGIGLGTFGAIILYQIFRHAGGGIADEDLSPVGAVADAAVDPAGEVREATEPAH
jgi:uracil-xanthine permease